MMCVNTRPDYTMHWSSDPLLANQELKDLISRNHFSYILNHVQQEPQTLAQIANLNFRAHHYPIDHVCIDEGLICFKGRYQHRVHIRGKPNATGLKIYALADEIGYVYAFELYHVDRATVPEIVMGLLEKLPSKHFKVYHDRAKCHFFTTLFTLRIHYQSQEQKDSSCCVSNIRLIWEERNNARSSLTDFLVDLIKEWRKALGNEKVPPPTNHPSFRKIFFQGQVRDLSQN